MGWRKTPRWLQNILPFSLTFTSIPYFMFGILLIYVVAFELHWLPATGGYDRDVDPGWNLPFIKSVISHSILPIVSIVLTSMGGWALGMRGLMIGVNNEDFFLLAQAKGLAPSRVFFRYGMRNAILPALTALALGLAALISGSTPGRVHLCLSRHRLYPVSGHHHAGLHGDADDLQSDDHHHCHQRFPAGSICIR